MWQVSFCYLQSIAFNIFTTFLSPTPLELHFLHIFLLTSFPRQFSRWNFLKMHHFISPSTFRKYVLTTSLLDVFHLRSPFICPHPLLSSPTVSLGLAHKAGTFPHVPISSRTAYYSTLKMEAAHSSQAWVNFWKTTRCHYQDTTIPTVTAVRAWHVIKRNDS